LLEGKLHDIYTPPVGESIAVDGVDTWSGTLAAKIDVVVE